MPQTEMTPVQEILDYLLGENSQLHPMFGGIPTIKDMCYSAFMKAKVGITFEDGHCDWMTDTLPLIEKGIAMIKKKIAEDKVSKSESETIDSIPEMMVRGRAAIKAGITLKEQHDFLVGQLWKGMRGEPFDALIVQAAIGDLKNYYATIRGSVGSP